MPTLSQAQIEQHLAKLPGWELSGTEISRTFNFGDYYRTMAFVNAVAWIAHRQDHHPDMEVGYNKCRVRFSTHSAGGVTEKDIECATLVQGLSG